MIKRDDCVKLYEVGDTLYKVGKNGITKITIVKIDQYPHCVYRDNLGNSYFNHTIAKSCFKTQEEAEKEELRRTNVAAKRLLLKEYETTLNERLNLTDHYIVK